MGTITQGELAEILTEAGHKHHHSFISSDGVDPEWPTWYAPFIQAKVWDGFGEVPTQSELIHLLVAADKAHRAAASEEPWPSFYATYLLERLAD